MKPKLKMKNQKTKSQIQFTIWEQFLQFKACKSGEIDTIGSKVA